MYNYSHISDRKLSKGYVSMNHEGYKLVSLLISLIHALIITVIMFGVFYRLEATSRDKVEDFI